jgi:hypothetical protein
MKLDDSLSNVFGVAPMPSQSTEVITKDGEIITPPNEKVENDYDTARNNLRELLTTGQTALMHALDVAKQSEHPRAFEVVGNLMKQLADVNQQLMDIHQQKQKLDGPKETKKSGDKVTNNAIFVGSTADLNKMLNKMTKGE